RDLRMLRDHRLDSRHAHLDRLLHEIVEARVLQRREQQVQIGGRSLCTRLSGNMQGAAALAGLADAAPPLAVPPIEEENGSTLRQPKHIEQVIRLVAVERDLGAALERRVEIEPRGTEVVARHSEPTVTGSV